MRKLIEGIKKKSYKKNKKNWEGKESSEGQKKKEKVYEERIN